MTRELARKVADAVLYEGYMLYPYRRSALKNRQRWSFGILYPPEYAEVQSGTERRSMHSELLVEADVPAKVQIELRFLHLARHQEAPSAKRTEVESPAVLTASGDSWDEGIERALEFEIALDCGREEIEFGFPGNFQTDAIREAVSGTVSAATELVRNGVLKISIDVKNTTTLGCDPRDRDSALLRSLVSAHVILSARSARFVSLLEPPKELQEPAEACVNIGNFPVLIGSAGEREMLLCSPIVLYDYPQIAPESAGDFYDATEMDEMLTLRTLTLTEDEKDQAKNGDLRIRNLLERTEKSAREQLMRTHGAIRSLRPVIEDLKNEK